MTRSESWGPGGLGAGPGQLDAAALAAASATLAGWLRAQGVGRLGLYADNGSAWVVADRAARCAGLAVVPLPPFFSDAQLVHVLSSAGIDGVLVDDPGRARRLGLTAAGIAPGGLGLWRRAAAPSPLPPGCAKVTFTSGSTGTPKGVCLSAEHLDRVVDSLAATLALLDCRRHLCALPLSTLLENVAGVEVPLRLGAEVLLPAAAELGWTGSSGLDPQRFTAAIAAAEPHSLILLPQLLVALVAACDQGWRPPSSLRFVAVGGARVAPALLCRARDHGLPVYEGYGLSECGSVVALNHPGADRPGSVGRPLPHARVRVVDGEIHVAGGTFLGYLSDTEAAPAEVATGDLGYLDADGFLHVTGRRKSLLISSFGRNISPEWLESELLQYPELAQCVVVGDGRPFCGVLIATRDPALPDAVLAQRVASVNRGLPDYAQLRRWWRLPEPLTAAAGLLTANGRPRRAVIAERYRDAIDAFYR